MNIGQVSKAIVAFITAGGGLLVSGLTDGHLTQAEIIVAIVTAVTAAAAVFSVVNAPVSASASSTGGDTTGDGNDAPLELADPA